MATIPGNVAAPLPDNNNQKTQQQILDAVIQNAPSNLILPRDGKVISLLLQAQGITEVEPKVILMLLEFSHRYVAEILSDAQIYSDHANKNTVDIDDVTLAVQSKIKHSFIAPPPKEFMIELAEEKNKIPLPPVTEKYGLRLPPERHCLTAINFDIVPEIKEIEEEIDQTIGYDRDQFMKQEDIIDEIPSNIRQMDVDEDYD